jgi:hypothetical protein
MSGGSLQGLIKQYGDKITQLIKYRVHFLNVSNCLHVLNVTHVPSINSYSYRTQEKLLISHNSCADGSFVVS